MDREVWVVLATEFEVRFIQKSERAEAEYTMDIEAIIYGWLLLAQSMDSEATDSTHPASH